MHRVIFIVNPVGENSVLNYRWSETLTLQYCNFFPQDFCKFCCTEQIADVYGEDSEEMIRFEDVIDGLETEVAM